MHRWARKQASAGQVRAYLVLQEAEREALEDHHELVRDVRAERPPRLEPDPALVGVQLGHVQRHVDPLVVDVGAVQGQSLKKKKKKSRKNAVGIPKPGVNNRRRRVAARQDEQVTRGKTRCDAS